MNEMTLTLNSPIAEEQWDALTDVDLDNSEYICFHTKNGKQVEYKKQKKGKWIDIMYTEDRTGMKCSECGYRYGGIFGYNYCPNCGADMRGEQNGK